MLDLTIRLVASLAVVVGLMLVLARLAGRRMRGTRGSAVQVVHRQPLSRGSGVAVVTVGTRVLVLGTTEQQVSLLTELDPDEMLDGEQLAALDQLDQLDRLDPEPETPSDIPSDIPFGTVLAGVARSVGEDDEPAERPAEEPAEGPAARTETRPASALLPDDWRETYAAQRRAFEIAAGIAPAATSGTTPAPAPAPAPAPKPTARTLADFDGFDVGADLIDLTDEGTDGMDVVPTRPAVAVPATAPAEPAAAPEAATPVVAPLRAPGSGRRASRPVAHGSALSGSILAPDTWRQAIAAVTGRAS